jgi:hypothetical protein
MRGLQRFAGCGVTALSAMVLATPIAAADDEWTMPNLVGKDLQGAQDAIQSLTLGQAWYSGSTDLTGQDRAQVVDRNWMVCTSTPPPGTMFNVATKIDFGVVRIDSEKCP